jgi:hypothetical protein
MPEGGFAPPTFLLQPITVTCEAFQSLIEEWERKDRVNAELLDRTLPQVSPEPRVDTPATRRHNHQQVQPI